MPSCVAVTTPLKYGRRHVERLSPHSFQPSRREKGKRGGSRLLAHPRSSSLVFLSGKGTHVGLSAAVERGPSNSLCPLERIGQGCPLLRASNEHSFIVRVLRARRAAGRSFSILPSSLAISRGWGLIDLPLRALSQSAHLTFKGGLVDPRLRASNEHIPIVRVPRAGGRPGCPSHP